MILRKRNRKTNGQKNGADGDQKDALHEKLHYAEEYSDDVPVVSVTCFVPDEEKGDAYIAETGIAKMMHVNERKMTRPAERRFP